MNTLFVGIDVSSKSNVVYLMLDNGVKHSNFSLPNSLDGSSTLVKRIFKVAHEHSITKIYIGIEATSVYGDNLVYFLREDNTLLEFEPKIFVLNPRQVSKFKELYNDLQKNDWIDSFVIADCLRFGRINKEVYFGDYRYKALQNLTRARFFTVQNLVQADACRTGCRNTEHPRKPVAPFTAFTAGTRSVRQLILCRRLILTAGEEPGDTYGGRTGIRGTATEASPTFLVQELGRVVGGNTRHCSGRT